MPVVDPAVVAGYDGGGAVDAHTAVPRDEVLGGVATVVQAVHLTPREPQVVLLRGVRDRHLPLYNQQ